MFRLIIVWKAMLGFVLAKVRKNKVAKNLSENPAGLLRSHSTAAFENSDFKGCG